MRRKYGCALLSCAALALLMLGVWTSPARAEGEQRAYVVRFAVIWTQRHADNYLEFKDEFDGFQDGVLPALGATESAVCEIFTKWWRKYDYETLCLATAERNDKGAYAFKITPRPDDPYELSTIFTATITPLDESTVSISYDWDVTYRDPGFESENSRAYLTMPMHYTQKVRVGQTYGITRLGDSSGEGILYAFSVALAPQQQSAK